MSLASAASLLVAVSGLKEVQSLLQAIHAADAASGKVAGPTGLTSDGPGPAGCCGGPGAGWGCGPAAIYEQTPSACIKPRRVFHPEPRYLPRPVLHPRPRYVERPLSANSPLCPPTTTQQGPAKTGTPFATPWRTAPSANPVQTVVVNPIKVVTPAPDMGHVGLTIDMFL
jgi:hypothetical protein